MITPDSRRSLFKSVIASLVLALPITSWAQSVSASPAANDNGHRTHTITISYANGAWLYTIIPAQSNPKKARIKRKDTVNWVCADGSWQVFFKNGATPLVNGNGDPVSTLDGASGATAGATIGTKPKDNDAFDYGVRVQPNSGGGPVVDDPQIIIES